MKFHLLILVIVLFFSCNNKREISKDLEVNTIHNKQTADITVVESNQRDFFRNCKSYKKNDNIILTFTDYPYSEYSKELKILKKNNQYISEFKETAAVLDSSYKPPFFKVIEQKLSFNQTKYKKGDSLKGIIDIKILANYKSEGNLFDTIKIKGNVKTIVE